MITCQVFNIQTNQVISITLDNNLIIESSSFNLLWVIIPLVIAIYVIVLQIIQRRSIKNYEAKKRAELERVDSNIPLNMQFKKSGPKPEYF